MLKKIMALSAAALLGLAGLSDLGVDLPPLRLRYPKGDDLMPLPVFHLFSPPHRKSGMGLSALQRNHTIPDFSVDSHTVLWELSESYQLASRGRKVGAGFCPQKAFGSRLRQAKRSACPAERQDTFLLPTPNPVKILFILLKRWYSET